MKRYRSNSVQSRSEARRRAGRAAVGCAVESLEGRQLFSVLTVNTTADTNASDGQLSLREAIALIQNGGDDNAALTRTLDGGEAAQVDTSTDAYGVNDRIVFDASVAGGTITLGEEGVSGSAFNITTAMTIGGGTGVTLSGGVSQAAWRAFYVNSTGNLTLNNLTITNFSDRGTEGDAVNAPVEARGGAIWVDNGTLTLNGSTLSNNSAVGPNDNSDGWGGTSGRGGAIYAHHATVSITGGTLDHNSATGSAASVGSSVGSGFGGAIYLDFATLTLSGATLSDNSAVGGAAPTSIAGDAEGGAIYVDSLSTLTATGSTNLLGNTATAGIGMFDGNAAGGAIANEHGTFTLNITGGTIRQNAATGGTAYGGAIFSESGTASLTFTSSTLSNNAATSSGGPGSALGGAVYVDTSTLTVTNSTLAGNAAGDAGGNGGMGGAIFDYFGDTIIRFSTLSANTATGGGRGLYAWSPNTLEIDNSILGQSDNSVSDLKINGALSVSGSNNLIRSMDTFNVTNGFIGVVSSADPRLAAFGDYGGGVQTFALLPDSPALDAAGPAGVVTQDVRGLGRDYNGASDIGAFESQGYTLTLDSSSTPQSVAVGQAFGNSLGVTLTENGFGAAIPGATINFAVPSSGASATVSTTATTDGGGDANVTATANGIGGSYAVVASLGGPQDETVSFALSNTAPPTISSANSVTFTVGSAGTFTITTTGGPTATLSNSDSLPSGVAFVDNGDGTATLSGTPAGLTGGTYTLTFTASNGILPHATQSFTLTVDEAAAITSANHATITAGSAGTFTVTTSGFPAGTLSETGSLPFGVTFTDNGDGTGTFSGTAFGGTGGVYTVTLDADNGVGSIASQTFTLTVDEAPSITSSGDMTFTSGSAGTFTITTSGYPVVALTKTGSLPTGVTFVDNGDGTATLSGTPTGIAGDYTLTITASNGISPDATQTFTLTVDQAPTITSANHATFTAGTAGSFTITTGGFPGATLSKTGSLPSGVTFVDNGDGTATLAGTPAGLSGGTYTLTITASNGVSPDDTKTFTLTVDQAPAITSANSLTLNAGLAGTFTVTTTGFPVGALTKTGSLPAGMTFVDNGNGTATLSGTPAAGTGGLYTLTISADNGVGSAASQTFTLAVNQVLSFTSTDHVTFTVGVAGTFTLTTTGFPAAALARTGVLPAGVMFHDNGDGTATLSGTPTGAAASYSLSITDDNGGLIAGLQAFTLTVNPAPISGVTGTAPTITSPATVNLVTGQATTFTVTTTGSPIATLHVTGTLPAGLTFVDNGDGTGTLSGTATAAGTYAVSVVADNGVEPGATQALTLTVIPSHPVVVASGHAGGKVQVNNPDGSTRFTIKNPFKKGVGSRLASADVNGDGVADIIMAAGAGGQPQVLVYDGATGNKLAGFLAFAKSFTGGLFVASADVDGDGTPDLVVGQGLGGTSKVRVFSGKDQTLLAEFNPIGTRNAAGVRVAAADLNGDGYAEVVAAQGAGDGRAVVKVFDGRALTKGNAKNLATLSRAELGFAGGAYVATGDVNGDGTPDVVVSQSAGTRPTVATFNGKKVAAGKNLGGALISKFNTASDNGARIASYDFDQDGFDDIITSATTGSTAIVKIFSGADGSVLDTIESDQAGQVFVA